MTAQDGCRIQLRIDGANAAGSSSASSANLTIGDVRLAGGQSTGHPAVATASFAGLDAGAHTVQIAVSADSGAATCIDNIPTVARAIQVDELLIG